MSIESVKEHLSKEAPELEVLEFDDSSATVELAAAILGVEPNRIGKTMAFWQGDKPILIISKGSGRVDNKKYKAVFKTKAKMLKLHEVEAETGHPIGGVCPFGLSKPLQVYLDENLKEFDYIYPAAGSPSSAVKISMDRLEELTHATWVDVCK